MNVVCYSRVSTIFQEYDAQVADLNAYCAGRGWNILNIYAEKVSGTKTAVERPALSELINFVKSNKVDKVVVTELSRISRSTTGALSIVQELTSNKISLHIKNIGLDTLNADGNTNAMGQFMILLLAEFANLEKATTRTRMAQGYSYYRKNGGRVGCPQGYRKNDEQYLSEYTGVVKLLKKDYPLRKIATLEQVSVNTVAKVKRLLQSA
jgi:DNA invertase Pin-like site-specific DNA recombinase